MNTATRKRGSKGWHPFSTITDRKIKLEEGEGFNLCFDFVARVCNEPCSDRRSGHTYSRNCVCLSILQDWVPRQAAVAKYMANFIEKPQQERHSIISEWQRYTTTTNNNPRCFFIPFVAEDDDEDEGDEDEEQANNDGDDNKPPLHALKEWMVCKDAIALLLDYGKFKWRTCQKAVKNNRLPGHGNKGKVNGKAKHFANDVKDDLHEFFHQLKQFGSPKATRLVREETGMGLRDAEVDVVELPTAWSKRAMYARFCYERGYVMTASPRGSYVKKERSDAQWNEENKKPICSWGKFISFWQTEYPLIRIASPSADICTDCHIFFNRSKYAVAAENLSDRDNDTSGDESTNYVKPPRVENPDLETDMAMVDAPPEMEEATAPDNLQLVAPQVDVTEREAILMRAALHVNQAMVQRNLANQKIQESIDSKDLPHCDRHYCFIADFSQNMELPFFGESQPGDTYYFSPLKINVFGIVDCSIFGGKLSAHVYHEGVGKKGGNNVASMLVNEFKRLNIMVDDKQGKELTIIMDNCAGQNKNRMVLRLALYLVEAEYFAKVTFVFYIVGHTKNACDRWFNMLKNLTVKRNIYTFEQLTDSMNTHANIHVTVTKESDFKDWDHFFNTIYKQLETGKTHKTHIFSSNNDNKGILFRKDDDLPETPVTFQNLMKRGTDTPNRAALLKPPALRAIVPPGIPPIKQVELFTKYRGLIPEAFRETTCPDPGEEIKKKIRSDRNTKQRERSKRIKLEATKKRKTLVMIPPLPSLKKGKTMTIKETTTIKETSTTTTKRQQQQQTGRNDYNNTTKGRTTRTTKCTPLFCVRVNVKT